MILLDKPLGLTSLQAIERFKQQYPKFQTQTLSYAGRLDPMAEGLLLILVGAENKKRELYQGLQKTYSFSALFGVATDSYDILGKVISFKEHITDISKRDQEIILPRFIGKQEQAFPPYSSKPVNGKPLFWWARQGMLSQILVPKKQITIYDLQLTNVQIILASDLQQTIAKRIQSVNGNFRQKECLESWSVFFRKSKINEFPVASYTVSCSPGTYVRSLVHQLGKSLNTNAVTFGIKRISVGSYSLEDAIKV